MSFYYYLSKKRLEAVSITKRKHISTNFLYVLFPWLFTLLKCSVCHRLPPTFFQVKEGDHYFANLAYGGSDAGHIWADPKEDKASALYFDANFEKAFKIDDISSVFHYELLAENGKGTNIFFFFIVLSSSYFWRYQRVWVMPPLFQNICTILTPAPLSCNTLITNIFSFLISKNYKNNFLYNHIYVLYINNVVKGSYLLIYWKHKPFLQSNSKLCFHYLLRRARSQQPEKCSQAASLYNQTKIYNIRIQTILYP